MPSGRYVSPGAMLGRGADMDRKQKEQRVQQHDGKVFNVGEPVVNVRYQSPDYVFEDGPRGLTSTGRFIVFRLTPISGKPTSFEPRWDGGSRDSGKQERYDLDIDMVGVSRREAKKFERGQAGYSGHHTTVPSVEGTVCEVL